MKKMSIVNIILIITATSTGLIAGLFYAYSCSVNPGLAGLPDAQYVAAMQSINSAILNPVFFASFLGTLILLPLSGYLNFSPPYSRRFAFLLAAALIYIIGSFGVTIFGNVPLNDALGRINLKTASTEEISNARIVFENLWNRLHSVRTIASIISLILVIIANRT
jgi:uncharacterized membrane protein